MWLASEQGLYRSTDAGKMFSVASDESLVINSIVLHPDRPDRIILGVEGDGVYVSEDRGRTLRRSSDGLHNLRITAIAADPFEKDRIYASVVFGGNASGIYRSDDAGATWTKWSRGLLPEVSAVAPCSAGSAWSAGNEASAEAASARVRS